MRISHLSIQNFRSIKLLECDIPQVCALVGPNNAGKSNILKAIQKVLGKDWLSVNSFNEEDIYSRNPELDITINITIDPPIKYTKFKLSDSVMIPTLSFEYTRYKRGENKGEPRLQQQGTAADGRPPMVLKKAPKKGEKHEYEPLIGLPPEIRESVPLIYIGTNRSLQEQLPSARYSLLRQLFEDINRDFNDPQQTITVKDPKGFEFSISRSKYFHDLMENALALLRTDKFTKLENSIKENALRQFGLDPILDSNKLDLYFAPFDTIDFYKALELRIREGNFTINATELGEGLQNTLVLAILQAFEAQRKKGAILLIEEPEMFLHPQMQRSLYKTLIKIGETNQVIYTTHSPHFVGIPYYNQIGIVRKNIDGTFVQFSNIAFDARRKEKLLKELDPGRNELFFASRILFVEGDTEKLVIPEYALRLGVDLDKTGATIIEVGGKRNLAEFCLLAQSFNIPFGIVYDEDSSDIKIKSEETEYNSVLDNFKVSGNRVWCLKNKYEDELKAALGGESKYQKFCEKYPDIGKPARARLIAADTETEVPEKVIEMIEWLAGNMEIQK
jgi:predicted ATP-dependent endonuclease of OLD family